MSVNDLRGCVEILESVLERELRILLKSIDERGDALCLGVAINQIKDVIRTLEATIEKLEAAGSTSSPI
jgi:hypothetical protein